MDGAQGGTSQALGVALIGAGMVAGTHLKAIVEAWRHVTLRGVAARHSERAAALLQKLPSDYPVAPRVYSSLDEVIDDKQVAAAIIVTPPNVREELIKPLAGAGKHILLEKPVARNLGEAETIIALCEDANVRLGIVFQHRFRAASLKARALVDSGALGELGLVEATVPYWRDQSYYNELGRGTYERDGGGVLISQAIHTIDLMLSLAGAVVKVQALTATSRFHQMESEDFAASGLEFANGAVGSLMATTASFPGSAETIRLHFEKASLHLEAGILSVNWRDGSTEQHGAIGGTGGGGDPMAFTHEWHQSVLEDFAEAVRRNMTPAISGRDALAAHRLIHSIEQSGRLGRMVEVSE